MKDQFPNNISVAIAGAGLSGLCLAQGLLQAGFDVRVYEQDPSLNARRQGYRITIDSFGAAALKRCLPPPLFEAVRMTASSGGQVGYFRFTNANFGEIFKLTFKRDPQYEEKQLLGQVDRGTLRTIMLSGLQRRVHFGKAVANIETDHHDVTLHFTDGSSERAALVVGADGIHSLLREKLLPECPVGDTGTLGIYGETPCVKNGKPLIPSALKDCGVLALGIPGRFFFFTGMVFDNPPQKIFEQLVSDQEPPITEDYLMWAIGLPKDELPEHVWELRSDVLHRIALNASQDFHPLLRGFVEHADVEYTILTALSAATRPKHWPASRVTLMGDAVHVMPPTGAHGGNTALRDAALLTDKLQQATEQNTPLEDAIQSYQQEMLSYAFKEVASSVKMLRSTSMTNPLTRLLILRMVPWLRSFMGHSLIVNQ
jgi:2-polyprenyl-6-methoxyphenol hydroxylase-like FAD-dependent oxidoreductase